MSSARRLAVRADGDSGAEAGMGHVYRSLAFARLMAGRIGGLETEFFMRDLREGISKVRGEGFAVRILPVKPRREDYEWGLKDYGPDVLMIDCLGSSGEVMAAGRAAGCRIVTLDDLEPSAGEADAVVNGILWATRMLPASLGRARVYQGVEYMPLRGEFAAAHDRGREVRPRVEEILVSTGGADGCGLAVRFMKALAALPFECRVRVVVGPASGEGAAIGEAARRMTGRARFQVVEDTPRMAELILEADLAVVTGGTVMFETAACGTPAVVVCSHEHQVPQAEWFAREGAVQDLGLCGDELDGKRLTCAVTGLAGDPGRRKEMSAAGKRTVDGRGMERCADIVQALFEPGTGGQLR